MPEWRQERPNYDIVGRKSNAAKDQVIKEESNESGSNSDGEQSDGENKAPTQQPAESADQDAALPIDNMSSSGLGSASTSGWRAKLS